MNLITVNLKIIKRQATDLEIFGTYIINKVLEYMNSYNSIKEYNSKEKWANRLNGHFKTRYS